MPDTNGPRPDQNVVEGPPADPGQQQPQNGAAKPGLEELTMMPGMRTPDHIRDMISTSMLPEEFVPRSIRTKAEAARAERILQEENMLEDGDSNMKMLLWYEYAHSISIDGIGREQGVSMITGGLHRKGPMGFLKGLMGRMNRAEDNNAYKGPTN